MQDQENFQTLCKAIQIIIRETHKPRYLPDWLYAFWQPEVPLVLHLKDEIEQLIEGSRLGTDLTTLELKLVKLLDKERYLVTVHLMDLKLRSRMQDALITALFFSVEDVQRYNEYVLAEQNPGKFIEYASFPKELDKYKDYLKKQHAVHGRFIKNFTEEELTLAAKEEIINGKLLDYFKLTEFLKHGFHYIIQELKALEINKIEKGYLTIERMNSYLEKISLTLHPAHELQLDPANLVKNARYILEDIINAAGISEPADQPLYPEHAALIKACYFVDEMFKVASSFVDIVDEL